MIKIFSLCYRALLVFSALLLVLNPVYAQGEGAPTAENPAAENQVQEEAPKVKEGMETLFSEAGPNSPRFNPEEYTSMVFTHWEHVAIKDARRQRGAVRAPTDAELMRDLKTREDPVEKVKPPPEKREIRLSGIVYKGGKDWTIWLNEQRVTPDAIPEEVMDLKVYKTYIEFKWFDDYTNKIFPIRLRPHQRFNIDTRIFLPG